jgi:hypothetical protein
MLRRRAWQPIEETLLYNLAERKLLAKFLPLECLAGYRSELKLITPPEDLEQLVNFRIAGKEWSLRCHFGKYASNRPHID